MANNERVLASEMSIEAARETALDSVAVAADQHTAGRTTHISVSEAAQHAACTACSWSSATG